MYGDGFLRHLSMLASESAQLAALTHSSLFEPFWNTVEYCALGAIVDCNAVRSRPLFFWKESLKHIAHGLGVGMVPEKSVRTFLTRIDPASDPKRFKSRGKAKPNTKGSSGSSGGSSGSGGGGGIAPVNGWIPLKRTNRALLLDGVLHFFREEVFPPEKEPYRTILLLQRRRTEQGERQARQSAALTATGTAGADGAVVAVEALVAQPEEVRSVGAGCEVTIGPWSVAISAPIAEGDPTTPELTAGLDVATVMAGSFAYALPAGSGGDDGDGDGDGGACELRYELDSVANGQGKPSASRRPAPLKTVDIELVRAIPLLVAVGQPQQPQPPQRHVVVSYRFLPTSRRQDGKC
jgi:hypothetical protein